MSNPGAKGGWAVRITVPSLMTDPRQEHTLRFGLIKGVEGAQKHCMEAAGPEYRNFRRSHRLEGCRGVVKP